MIFVAPPCPACKGPLRSDSLDEDFGLLRCADCDNRFETSSLARAAGRAAEAPTKFREKVPMPTWGQMQEGRGFLRLKLRRLGIATAMAVFTAVAVTVSTYAWMQGLNDPEAASFPRIVAFVVAGGLNYSAVALLLNRTTLTVTPGRVHIRHGPIPFRPSLSIRTADLVQLYCSTLVTNSGYGNLYTYEVWAITTQKRRIPLIKKLEYITQALWFEQEVERFLGIRDERVAGEADPKTPRPK